MLSRLFGKRDKPADDAGKAKDGQSGKDEGRETAAWSTWDKMEMPKAAPAQPPKAAPVPTPRGGPAAQDSTYTGLSPLYTRPVIRTSSMAPLSTGSMRAAPPAAEDQIDFVLPTAPMGLSPELTLEERKNLALEIVSQHHQRIANTIRTLWGYRECSAYINRLIMAGGDGMGQARVGFNQEAVAAMLALSDIHDAEFGPPSTLGGGLSLAP